MAFLLFQGGQAVSREVQKKDPPIRTSDSAGVRCEPAADAVGVNEKQPDPAPVVEADDREEAGYGYGV